MTTKISLGENEFCACRVCFAKPMEPNLLCAMHTLAFMAEQGTARDLRISWGPAMKQFLAKHIEENFE